MAREPDAIRCSGARWRFGGVWALAAVALLTAAWAATLWGKAPASPASPAHSAHLQRAQDERGQKEHAQKERALDERAQDEHAQVALGRQLFFDRRLSANGTLSCALCHLPGEAFTATGVRTSVGAHGVSLRRSAPSLWNVAEEPALFWDGRAPSLAAQALQPLVDAEEMANPSLDAVVARLAALEDYRAPWQAAYGMRALDIAGIAQALAAYQRTLVARDSPVERHLAGDTQALSPLARLGLQRFGELGCARCHTPRPEPGRGAAFTDRRFHNTGVQARSEAAARRDTTVVLIPGLEAQVSPAEYARFGAPDRPDAGRFEVTGQAQDLRAFRTPSLRNVALTPPYMHNGSLPTLDAVLDHYAAGGWPADPAQSALLKPLALSQQDRAALKAMLEALTSPQAQAVQRSGVAP